MLKMVKRLPELKQKKLGSKPHKYDLLNNVSRRSIPDTGYSKCKSPETKVYLLKEASVVEQSELRERCKRQVREVEVQGEDFIRPCKAL